MKERNKERKMQTNKEAKEGSNAPRKEAIKKKE